ncbi:MAG: hypothetical protein JSW61_08020 [Candidatus Thorarchaeota archaeon]|nr:MAG: hypothetical protein JSW61_08020 [Candidatus Thorarchaeota archaeon]
MGVRRLAVLTLLLMILLVNTSGTVACKLQTSPNESHAANAIWLELSDTSIGIVGARVNLTVWLNTSMTSYAWQVILHLNSTYFNVTKAGYTDGNRSAFFSDHSSMSVSPVVNNEVGVVLCGETLLGVDEREPGFGSLLWVELNLTTMTPQSHLDFSLSQPYGIDTFVLNPYSETIPMDIVEGATISVGVDTVTTTTTTTTTTTPMVDTMTVLVVVGGAIAVCALLIARRRRDSDE